MIELDASVCRASMGIAFASARALALRSRGYGQRAVARTLGLLLACDVARGLLAELLAAAPRPYVGAARTAFLCDWALLLAFPALAAALAVSVFARARAWSWSVPALWGAAVLFVAASYPERRGPGLLWVFPLAHLLSVLAQLVLVAVYAARRGWPGAAQTAALILLSGDVAALAGPLVTGDPWWTGRWATSAVYAVLSIEQLRRYMTPARWPLPSACSRLQ